ncbi:electron transport complex subunit RsxB [Pseudomonas sp. R1-18]|uniref:electron transport complex subunit RsxB n=1 Tax=Pseudomonas sp. R1-18 TaxID=1632772 RepID=UPI003DAA2292
MTDAAPYTLPGATPTDLIERIDALLPQTQCGKCGHPGCRPYAQGIAAGEPISRCPPGGQETIVQLAQLLGTPILPLDTERGSAPAQIAYIREAECIGCTKCIQACPVDAIVGAAKLMHTVLIDECTGCDLCVAPCPVDCIEMRPLPRSGVTPIVGGLASTAEQHRARSRKRQHARQRFEARTVRLRRELEQRTSARATRQPTGVQAGAGMPGNASTPGVPTERAAGDEALKKARIAVAMSRAQLHKSLKAFGHPPVAEQAAQLVELQKAFEATERELERLMCAAATTTAPLRDTPMVDNGAVKRAKIQLAMARAAYSKACAAPSSADEQDALRAAMHQAECALQQAES